MGTEEGGKEFNSTNQNGLLLCAYANYPGATGTDTGMPYQTQLSCQAAGRYVWIVQNNTSLSFCEVEIWGSAPNPLFPLPYSNHWDIPGATFVNGLTGWMVQVVAPYFYTFFFTLADMNGIWLTDWSEAMALPTMTSELRFIFDGE